MAASFFAKLLGTAKKDDEKKAGKPLSLLYEPPPKEEVSLGKAKITNKIIVEQMNASVETFYFWILGFIRNPNALNYNVEKISDVYNATETSSYFGNVEARKAAQQDRVSQYMATIGNMTRSMFQMIRELRVLDERLDYFKKSYSETTEGNREAAEIALKGVWVDLVEGGSESASSVYGLARRVGFVTVPDLFFKINPKKGSDGVDKDVESLAGIGINRKVREVVKRKLMQYYLWKENVYKELTWRRKFLLKSLVQHYHSIKLYVRWLKPYLRNIRKLQMSGAESPDLITAFESAEIDLELIATGSEYFVDTPRGKARKKYQKFLPCLRVRFRFITLPEMAFQKEFQHRGAVHAGRTEITFEGFVVTKDLLEKYRKYKEDEDIELLKSVDASVEALADDLRDYLNEAGEMIDKEGKPKDGEKGLIEGMIEPFSDAFSGFKDLFSFGRKSRQTAFDETQESGAAEQLIKAHTYLVYDIFKKSQKFLSW